MYLKNKIMINVIIIIMTVKINLCLRINSIFLEISEQSVFKCNPHNLHILLRPFRYYVVGRYFESNFSNQ